MAKKSKEYSLHYLNQQYSAMRWLGKQGLTPEVIREFRWGMVDETTKTIRITRKSFFIKYDLKTGIATRTEDERESQITIQGSGHEWFFLHSRFICPWMFTTRPPLTWRKEGSRESLFPLEVVEKMCREIEVNDTVSILTKSGIFDSIEVSKLNITKMKTKEPTREAQVVSRPGR